MLPEDWFEVEGDVTSVISERSAYVRLSNGHILVAHGNAAWPVAAGGLELGDRVRVRVTPYDLSKGVLLSKQENQVLK